MKQGERDTIGSSKVASQAVKEEGKSLYKTDDFRPPKPNDIYRKKISEHTRSIAKDILQLGLPQSKSNFYFEDFITQELIWGVRAHLESIHALAT